MRFLIIMAFCVLSISIFAQKVENCGLDNNPQLTNIESTFLNTYFESNGFVDAFGKRQNINFDFSDKKILFVGNSTGSGIMSKKAYFDQIKNRKETGDKIQTDIYVLSEQEKVDSGGYDAFVTSYIKFFSKSSRRKVIKDIIPKDE